MIILFLDFYYDFLLLYLGSLDLDGHIVIWASSMEPKKPTNIDYINLLVLIVRLGTAELFIDIECSRVRDSSWMHLISFVTTRIGIELAAVQWKLPDCVAVGLQLYSARTFHVTLSPPDI